MQSEETDRLAQIIWDYHHLHHTLEKADCLFVLGSHDIRVADYAAQLFHEGWAPYILFSGGIAHNDDMLNTGWNKSEAEIFAERAMKLGIPQNKILLEKKAKNTGENVKFSEIILRDKGISFNKIIAVQKPYMERRAWATIRVYWPEKKVMVTSPPIDYFDYSNEVISREELINIMVGDLQRIIKYPVMGYQIVQDVPEKVMLAYKQLILKGFNKHLIKAN